MSDWFGSSWSTVAWVVASTTAIYATTVVAVRIAGRRTVARISAFDLIITVALGSIVATTAVSRSASYAQGATAVATLLTLQVAVGAARMRFPAVGRLIDFHPQVVLRDGTPQLPTTPLGPQLTERELRSKLREHGIFDPSQVAVVVLEPTGSVSASNDSADLHDHLGRR